MTKQVMAQPDSSAVVGENSQISQNVNALMEKTPEPKEKKAYSFLKTEKAQDSNSSTVDALNVSLGLIFILLLIFSLAWFMRKMGYSHIAGQGQLKLLATMNLGQKEKIALIQVGKQQLVVGITASQINTLHVLEEPLDASETQATNAVSSGQDNIFAKKLAETLNLNKSVKM